MQGGVLSFQRQNWHFPCLTSLCKVREKDHRPRQRQCVRFPRNLKIYNLKNRKVRSLLSLDEQVACSSQWKSGQRSLATSGRLLFFLTETSRPMAHCPGPRCGCREELSSAKKSRSRRSLRVWTACLLSTFSPAPATTAMEYDDHLSGQDEDRPSWR